MTTNSPPTLDPDVGLNPVIVGFPWYVNALNSESSPATVVIWTLATPRPGGELTRIRLSSRTSNATTVSSKLTSVVYVRCSPAITTVVLPPRGPEIRESPVRIGGVT